MINMYYALKYPDGRLVGLDTQSGGYPYATEFVTSAYLREAHEKNLKEMRDMQKSLSTDRLILVLLKIQEMPIRVSG